MRLSVIGTAGRGSDAQRFDRRAYDLMFDDVLSMVAWADAKHAVSGGAALADHLAVRAFLEGVVAKLTLYLPCRFENGVFVGHNSASREVAATTNRYHREFSKACGVDSLAELASVMSAAEVEMHEGFKRRNLEVAGASDAMLAFTYGRGPSTTFLPEDDGFSDAMVAGLKDGGTSHTWNECWRAGSKRHVNLNDIDRFG